MIRRVIWTVVLAAPLEAGRQAKAEEVWLSPLDMNDVTPMFMERESQPNIWNLMSILSCKQQLFQQEMGFILDFLDFMVLCVLSYFLIQKIFFHHLHFVKNMPQTLSIYEIKEFPDARGQERNRQPTLSSIFNIILALILQEKLSFVQITISVFTSYKVVIIPIIGILAKQHLRVNDI